MAAAEIGGAPDATVGSEDATRTEGTATALARGAAAGAVGTAVMTVAQTVEMRVSGRPPSMVPGQVAAKLLRLRPKRRDLPRVSIRMHWAHGVAQGTVRALVGRATGLSGPTAGAAHFAMMWSSDALLYRALGISSWPWRWSAAELAPDLIHKGLYAMVTSAVYERLRPGR